MKAFFPVQCTDTLMRIALLVKQTRLQQGVRQIDLAERLGITLRTFRRIEAGSAEGVSLRDFMLVVWGLGVSERLFQGLRDDETFSVEQLEAADRKRVRLPRNSRRTSDGSGLYLHGVPCQRANAYAGQADDSVRCRDFSVFT